MKISAVIEIDEDIVFVEIVKALAAAIEDYNWNLLRVSILER